MRTGGTNFTEVRTDPRPRTADTVAGGALSFPLWTEVAANSAIARK